MWGRTTAGCARSTPRPARSCGRSNTGAEILAEPLVADGQVYTANGWGVVSAYTTAGKKVWSFTAGDAVYSSPVLADGKVIFGCNNGWLYALDAATGKLAWVNKDAHLRRRIQAVRVERQGLLRRLGPVCALRECQGRQAGLAAAWAKARASPRAPSATTARRTPGRWWPRAS